MRVYYSPRRNTLVLVGKMNVFGQVGYLIIHDEPGQPIRHYKRSLKFRSLIYIGEYN